MPATSSEAIARKRANNLNRERAKRKAARLQLKKSDLPGYKIMARRMMPRIPENITKTELREMLARAAANTVEIGDK
jgi:hypothetical protein